MLAPTCSRAALQLLTTVLLVSTIANAAALPHQGLDSRAPVTEGEQLPAEVSAALRASVGDDPNNVFQKVEDAFKSRTGLDVIRDFLARIFGWNKDDDDTPAESSTSTSSTPSGTSVITTVPSLPSQPVVITILPSLPSQPVVITTVPSLPSESVIITEPYTPGVGASSEASSEVTSTSSASNGFSILPVGPVSTINVTLPGPTFSSVPFLNSTRGPLPTAVSITGEFSAIPFPGTGISSKGTPSTSVILVTATTTQLPLGTGTGISDSTATFSGIPIFPNTTTTTTTYAITPSGTGIVGTGSGSPISFTEIPIYPNTTSGLVTGLPGTGTAVGTGSPISFTEIPIYPNTTSGLVTGLPGTGTAVGTGAPISFSEAPVYPNTTTTTTFTTIEFPPSGTGAVGTGAVGTITGTGSPVSFTEIPLYPNVTTLFSPTTTALIGTGLPAIPTSSSTSNVTTPAFPGLLALRRICQDPVVKVVTLPLISRFYGPSGYPTLRAFPGCTVPNDRQAFQAPGLLNCSALGVEVQRCQASGRKVLLSVKGDGIEAVGGNANFGDPRVDAKPYGQSYSDSGSSGATYDNVGSARDDDDDDGLEKRQVSVDIDIDFPNFEGEFHLPHLPIFSKRPGRPSPTPRPTESKLSSSSRRSSVSPSRSSTIKSASIDTSKKSDAPSSTGRPTPPPRPNESQTLSESESSVFRSSSSIIEASSVATSSPPDGPDSTGLPIESETPSTSQSVFQSSSIIEASSLVSPTVISESFVPIISVATTIAGAPSSSVKTSTGVPRNITSSTSAVATTPVAASPTPATTASIPSIPDPTPFPNLFNENHPPTAFALTLFSLFGEGHTERADLRPLGPDVGGPASPKVFNGREWVTPPSSSVPLIERPLGEEVVVDGFDVQLPVQWKGKYQDTKFRNLVARLRELNSDAFKESGGIESGPGDLGADGESIVFFGFTGQLRKAREALASKVGWVEWDGSS